ncbi:geranylgeranylglyceryl/heptaprenylglyceryl phosphate synthase [candidate division WOR-3 bacterium]|uniref:Phosphoglycerol geranylgeranyltransferase n=1 Tax=candidate division WOR-3 bacterium TaxID=2052148 RepID=A0A660SII7_UNCW3|nr:MAG: geranylgeranylglyceryl/heptaprenylglyceryl phosphate synthase [candidate division WOR-3 bacterium]
MLYDELLKKRPGVFALLDPDREPDLDRLGPAFPHLTAILVGTSYLKSRNLDTFIEQIKSLTSTPVLIFPGGANQVSSRADGILFLSLLSGRNPQYLIGDQVRAVFRIRDSGLEVIPTGYLLIEGGNYTSVEYISNTRPIPRNKPEIAEAHALAAQYLGMKLVYLEAGSGAELPVPVEMVRAVRRSIDIPLIVGGGLKRFEDIQSRFEAGCDFVVIGTLIERDPDSFKGFIEQMKGLR